MSSLTGVQNTNDQESSHVKELEERKKCMEKENWRESQIPARKCFDNQDQSGVYSGRRRSNENIAGAAGQKIYDGHVLSKNGTCGSIKAVSILPLIYRNCNVSFSTDDALITVGTKVQFTLEGVESKNPVAQSVLVVKYSSSPDGTQKSRETDAGESLSGASGTSSSALSNGLHKTARNVRRLSFDNEPSYEGSIIFRTGNFGLIKPLSALPRKYQGCNVSFSTTSQSELTRGKKVTFTLENNDARKPIVQSICLLEEGTSNDTSPTSTSDTEGRISGRVVWREGDRGLIRPKPRTPVESPSKDVCFSTLEFDVEKGDEVEFILADSETSKPTAKYVWLVAAAGIESKPRSEGSERRKSLEFSKATSPVVDTHSNDPFQTVTYVSKIKDRHERKLIGRRFQGILCNVKRTYGYIEYSSNEENAFLSTIFFPKSFLKSASLDVIDGDIVGFTVAMDKKHKGPTRYLASCVKPLQFVPRPVRVITQIIDDIVSRVEADDSNSGTTLEVMNLPAVWKLIGNSQGIGDENYLKILNLILSLEKRSNSIRQTFCNVIETIVETKFCSRESGALKCIIEKYWKDGDSDIEKNIKEFSLIVLEYAPQKARMITSLTKIMLPKPCTPIVDHLYSMLKKLTVRESSDIGDLDWNELPLVPAIQELLGGPLEPPMRLRPVRKIGAYESPQEYMDIYFRLLRADCFSALCSGVQDYMNSSLDPRDMKVYKDVTLVGINIPEYGGSVSLGFKINFCDGNNEYESSSDLMYGNLLCFSPTGKFNDPIWATVRQRDPQISISKQVIWIELCTESNLEDDVTCLTRLHEACGRTMIAESPTYYIAYQSVLKALQETDPDSLSFKEELIYISPPLPNECLNDIGEVPIPETLDNSQTEAFKQTLQQRLSIIQGPPGTGKTFIGIELIRRALKSEEEGNLPILVLTYKNHALDEFLKGLLEFLPTGVCRIGGRSMDLSLQHLNINTLKRNTPRPHEMGNQRTEFSFECRRIKKLIEDAIRELDQARHLSWKTLIFGFSGGQIANLLLESMHFIKLIDDESPVDLQELWDGHKDLLYDEEVTADEKISKLESDSAFVTWLNHILKMWIPEKKAYQTIMTSEERISCFLVRQSKVNQASCKKKSNEIEVKDEKDVESVRKERLCAVWCTEKPLDVSVGLNRKKKEQNNMPELIPCAGRLAAEIPLTSVRSILDLWDVQAEDKAVLIQIILWNYRCAIEKKIKEHYNQYKGLQNSILELDNNHKVSILKKQKVIGMTITGASIHRHLLHALKPAIVLIEEAAEVLEPQLITVLGSWVKQLVLIGDHKQLRPAVETYDLVRKFRFDFSMMERLIENEYPYKTLHTQNRMRPEIANLLLDIYPELESNLERVEKNIPPNFIQSSIYFWDHEELEGLDERSANRSDLQETLDAVAHSRSVMNIEEAERAVRLALLFIQQGYEPKDITILAAYQGQVKLIRQLYYQAEMTYKHLFEPYQTPDDSDEDVTEVNQVKIHTIDMYQGDENQIVIVSLVRSNPYGDIGFLKCLNRRCVGQSRAKCGLYFIGNIATISAKHTSWSPLIMELLSGGYVGPALPLFCSKHRYNKTMAVTAADIPMGGLCQSACTHKMGCDIHVCKKPCQPFHSHDETQCREIVRFFHKTCKHPDKRKCSVPESGVICKKQCPKLMDCNIHPCPLGCQPHHSHNIEFCSIEIPFVFSKCGHRGKKKCGEEKADIRCNEWVRFKVEKCSHIAKRKCYEEESDVSCKELCPRKLSCGHACDRLCGEVCFPSSCTSCADLLQVEAQKVKKLEKARRLQAIAATEKELEELQKGDKKCYLFDLTPTGDTAAEFHDIEDRLKRYIKPPGKWFLNVIKITKVLNPELESVWLRAKLKMFDPMRTELKFYDASEAVITKIAKEGFSETLCAGRLFDGSISFYNSAIPLCSKETKQLLLCDVLVGKSRSVDKIHEDMCALEVYIGGYDSVFVKQNGEAGISHGEYILYRLDQILPKYIVHYDQCSYENIIAPTLPLNDNFEYHLLKPQRNYDPNNVMDMHYRLAESQFLRLTQPHDSKRRVTSVEYYVNPPLIRQFMLKQIEFQFKYPQKERQAILAFHGTPTIQNIENIMRNNFDLTKCQRCLYGNGIYFSEFPHISTAYSSGINKLVLCKILPGKSMDAGQSEQNKPITSGYDSHTVGADTEGQGRMVVISNTQQILPSYVITYE